MPPRRGRRCRSAWTRAAGRAWTSSRQRSLAHHTAARRRCRGAVCTSSRPTARLRPRPDAAGPLLLGHCNVADLSTVEVDEAGTTPPPPPPPPPVPPAANKPHAPHCGLSNTEIVWLARTAFAHVFARRPQWY